jgi:hypothetical protein
MPPETTLISKRFIIIITAIWPFPVCMHWWSFKLVFVLYDLLHASLDNSCSPRCVRRWIIRFLCYLNGLLHTSQETGLSSLCECWCLLRALCKQLTTHYTGKWPLISVYALMYIQDILTSEWLVTHVKIIWMRPTVCPLMILRCGLKSKLIIAM